MPQRGEPREDMCLPQISLDLLSFNIKTYAARASVPAGHVSDVQTRIQDKYPPAIFVHCGSYCLNLVINRAYERV